MIKKAISESFLRSQDPHILAPLVSKESGKYGATILFKSIDDLKESSFLKQKLDEALSDVKNVFSIDFKEVPLIYLISQSKAKNYAFNIKDKSGKEFPILIIKQFKMPSGSIGYNYIDLRDGKVIAANTENLANNISESIWEVKKKKAAEVLEINFTSNNLIREMDVMRNIQTEKIKRGDVTNLLPVIPMLKKSLSFLNDRISQYEGMIKYFEDKSKELSSVDGDHSSIFDHIYRELEKEFYGESAKYVKSPEDAVKALVMRYVYKIDQFEKDFSDGKLSKILVGKDGKQHPKYQEVINSARKVLQAIKEWEIHKREKANAKTEKYIVQPNETIELIAVKKFKTIDVIETIKKLNPKINVYSLSAGQELVLPPPADVRTKEPGMHDDIFNILPMLGVKDFTSEVAGNISGYLGHDALVRGQRAIAFNMERNKLNSFKIMKKGLEKILSTFNAQLAEGKLSIRNFSEQDIKDIRDGMKESLDLIGLWKTKILTKDGNFDKRKIGGVFEDAVTDLFITRYIAVVMQYIIYASEKSR